MNTLVLSDASPSLRYRALTELFGVDADDPEAAELRAQIPSSVEVQRAMSTVGAEPRDLAYLLNRLAYLRYSGPEIAAVAERIFKTQQPDGSWPIPPRGGGKRPSQYEGWTMIPQQTSLPLRGLVSAGYATDPRAERAYEWLLEQRLPDGTWPGNTKADLPLTPGAPGYRKLPFSDGCRVATTGAVVCLALHPTRRLTGDARVALDHLLARETRDQWALGFEVSRLLSYERPLGTLTFYANFDLAFLLDMATRCGASADDARVADLVEFLEDLRGPYGLWEHRQHPQLSRWLTLDLEVSLGRLASGDWTGAEGRVDFQAYPKRRRRY